MGLTALTACRIALTQLVANYYKNLQIVMFKNGPVAQSVEQRIENPCVGGSIPPRATSIYGVFLFEVVQ